MEFAKPQAEHAWLTELVGEWSFEGECGMPEKQKGTETVRSLGGLWYIGEGEGEVPGGGKAQTVMTFGYDPVAKTFKGTFIASMMTHLWIYTSGTLDGNVLTMEAEGPICGGPDVGGTAKYKDIITKVNANERTLTSLMLGKDGKWTQVMSAVYRRKK